VVCKCCCTRNQAALRGKLSRVLRRQPEEYPSKVLTVVCCRLSKNGSRGVPSESRSAALNSMLP